MLVLIVISLFSALIYLFKSGGGDDKKKMVRALTIRVALSASLFLILVVSILMGWITPGKL